MGTFERLYVTPGLSIMMALTINKPDIYHNCRLHGKTRLTAFFSGLFERFRIIEPKAEDRRAG